MKLKGIDLKGTYMVEFHNIWFEVFDEKGNVIYFEDDDGDWIKREYDEKDNVIYFENSNDTIVDNRAKEMTIEEIEKLLGYKVKIKGE